MTAKKNISKSNKTSLYDFKYVIMKCGNASLANHKYGELIGFCSSVKELEIRLKQSEQTSLMWRGKGIINEYIQADNGFYYTLIPIETTIEDMNSTLTQSAV